MSKTTAAAGVSHADLSNAIRALSMDAVEAAKSGHPGMPMGMADVATVLFTKYLKFDAAAPDWADRDRFVLSAGHGSMLIYALAHLLGYEGMSLDEVKRFRQLGSKTAGHPEYGHAPAVETTTGPLGQGLANAVGMAIAEAHLSARHGRDIVDHYTYAIAGDGCLMEGISQEAIALAGHLKLGKLIVLFDDNDISIDGPVSLSDSTNQIQRFAASGWETARIDGHDPAAIDAAIAAARTSPRPTIIACKTVIGKGAPNKAGTAGAHGSPLGADEIAGAREALGWGHAPFVIPDDILAEWRAAGARGAAERAAWEARLAASTGGAALKTALSEGALTGLENAVSTYKKRLAAEPQKVATRKASQMALEIINETVPTTLGGSADLTGSNNTKTNRLEVLSADDYGARYIHYGIREHGMAAAMNGMALHGGVIPYGGTFLVFTDYCRPAIRLSALMGQRVIYVMTHDSIGLGEDGPTHQPVEHMAALRAIPGLQVFRPADVVETAECWEAALRSPGSPSVIALTRQGLAQTRIDYVEENLAAKGGYEMRAAAGGTADVSIFATGSEVEIAIAARDLLQNDGIGARVVSMPCFERFEDQPEAYRQEVLGDAKARVAVEAGIRQGWDRYIGADG
ncbi:MAG: transketolase, partial [Pseudomonadota bacterium]